MQLQLIRHFGLLLLQLAHLERREKRDDDDLIALGDAWQEEDDDSMTLDDVSIRLGRNGVDVAAFCSHYVKFDFVYEGWD